MSPNQRERISFSARESSIHFINHIPKTLNICYFMINRHSKVFSHRSSGSLEVLLISTLLSLLTIFEIATLVLSALILSPELDQKSFSFSTFQYPSNKIPLKYLCSSLINLMKRSLYPPSFSFFDITKEIRKVVLTDDLFINLYPIFYLNSYSL